MSDTLDPTEIAALHALLAQVEEGGGADVDEAALLAASSTALRTRAYDAALSLARVALAADPESARGWSLAGAALEGLGRMDEAERAYEEATNLDDKDLVSAFALASVQARRGEKNRARALLNFILIKEHGSPDLRARAQALLSSLDDAPGGRSGART